MVARLQSGFARSQWWFLVSSLLLFLGENLLSGYYCITDFWDQVSRLCCHLVDHRHHGHRLLHCCLRMDHGDGCWQVEDLHWDVHELLMANMSSDHSRFIIINFEILSNCSQLALAWGFRDWHRHLQAISAMVAVGSVILYFLPESPRWLIARFFFD